MSNKLVKVVKHGDTVALITMNRIERHHALNHELATGLVDALEDCENDPHISAIVLTGAGKKAFCSGQDMVEQSGIGGEEGVPKSIAAYLAIDRFANSPLPIIAAINGYCYGGGAALAISCDIRLASELATFRLPGAEYGLVVGAAAFPRLVGAARAKELIFTAKKFSAIEAEKWGFVNSLFSADLLLVEALDMADAISKNSTIAVRESKRVIDAATLDQATLSLENEINSRLRGSEDQVTRFNKATKRVTGRS
jgi:enoyl-CoA hydratase/carnithine racemase